MSGESILVNQQVNAVKMRWPFQLNLRFVNWMPAVSTVAAITLLMLFDAEASRSGFPWRAHIIEAIVPLIAALQAAFLFAPEDEATLEVMLACPRPIVWVLRERLLILLGLFGSLALLSSLIGAVLSGSDLLSIIVRWVSPTIFLISVSLLATLVSRQPSLGVVMAIVMWFGFVVAGDALLDRFPFLWPVHIYLQPDTLKLTYVLNRITLLVIGIGLIALAAHQLRDEERLLIGRRYNKAEHTEDQRISEVTE